MIESNQLQNPYNRGQITSRGDINNTITDSGFSYGVNKWIVYIDGGFVASNTFNITFNGVTVNTAFNTDTATTLADIKTDLEAEALIASVTVSTRRDTEKIDEVLNTLEITFEADIQGDITDASITGGASQSEVTYEEFQYLRISPAVLVVSEDAELTQRVEEATVLSVTTTYIGEALPGASESLPVWRIKRTVVDASGFPATTTTLYADGNSRFDNVWADRGSITYS